MRHIAIIIALMFILACATPDALRDESESNATKEVVVPANTTEEAQELAEQAEETQEEQIETEETDEPVEEESEEETIPDDIVQVKTRDLGKSTAYSEIDGTVRGFNKVFSVDYTDKEAIIFDIAKAWDIGLNEARGITYFNGEPYLTPSKMKGYEKVIEAEEIKEATFEDVPIVFKKDEGYIRAIGCDLEARKIRIRVNNTDDKVMPFFRNVRPTPKAALVMTLNRKQLTPLNCEGKTELQPGEVAECVKINAYFMANAGGNNVNPDAQYVDIPDKVTARRPGYQEAVSFRCGTDPVIEGAANSNSTAINQTNSTA